MSEEQTLSEKQITKTRTWADNYLVQAWLILLMAALYSAVLILVQLNWGPIIDKNKREATYSQIPYLVPNTDVANVVEKTLEKDNKKITAYQCFDSQKRLTGWVLPASGQGFADAVDLLVGLDASTKKLTGLVVLNQKETPGLGNFIKEEYFRKQFIGTAADKDITVVKGQDGNPETNEIKALTGATISSQSVCTIINTTLKTWREELERQ